jgi:hypothetical protein
VASNWNLLMERLAGGGLTANERRLLAAIGRYTIGYPDLAGKVGRATLRAFVGDMDNRSFDKARDGLVAAGVIAVDEGSPGRGHSARYALLLDGEKVAEERPIPEPVEKVALQRPLPQPLKGRSGAKKKVAVERLHKGKREELPAVAPTATLQKSVFDAYLEAGGSLEGDKSRGALAQHTTSLAKAGMDEGVIVAAAGALGRESAFPGYLTQRARELAAKGGPCRWDGMDRSQLTDPQLAECSCNLCQKWLNSRKATAAPGATA